MKRWLLRPQAEQDLRSIRTYTRRTWGDAQARIYLSAIRATIKQATEFPDLGSLHEHLRHEYRTMRAGHHLVVYRESGDVLLIVRILHERMDIDTELDG